MAKSTRNYSRLDELIMQVDHGIRSLFTALPPPSRTYPGDAHEETSLSAQERRHAAGLMRVNHSGEICAQALYQGQAVAARLEDVRDKMAQAALEEQDHLAWCARRISELDSHTSYSDPFWYITSFMLGVLAGFAGDQWSLGFVVETERQVVEHLTQHLEQLPQQDEKSRAIVLRMREDEERHATVALQAGAEELPGLIKILMRFTAKLMTKTTYWM